MVVGKNVSKLATMVADNLVKKQNVNNIVVKDGSGKVVGFEMAIFMAIAEAIKVVIESLKNCSLFQPKPNPPTPEPTPNPAAALAVVNKPGLIHKFMLKRIIKHTGLSSRIEDRKVYNAMLETGKVVKSEDLMAAYNELDFDLV